MNKFDEMRVAVVEAKITMEAADHCAAQMANILIGRLHHCNRWALTKLKKELRNFNMHTGERKS